MKPIVCLVTLLAANGEAFQCPKGDNCLQTGCVYQNHWNCAQFWQCDLAGRAFLKDCPAGLEFDEKARVCNWAPSSTCRRLVSTTTTTTTTPEPTTATPTEPETETPTPTVPQPTPDQWCTCGYYFGQICGVRSQAEGGDYPVLTGKCFANGLYTCNGIGNKATLKGFCPQCQQGKTPGEDRCLVARK